MGTTLGVSDTMAHISSKLSGLVPFSACALFLYDDEARDALLPVRDRHRLGAAPAARIEERPGTDGLGGAQPTSAGQRATKRRSRSGRIGSAHRAAVRARLPAASPASNFIGTLAVYHTTAGFYRDDHRRLLDRVCEQAAAVIHNAVVFEQTQEASLTDPLTGLPNTRFMFMHLTRELARAHAAGVGSLAPRDGPERLQGHQRHLRAPRRRPRAARSVQGAARPSSGRTTSACATRATSSSSCSPAAAVRKRSTSASSCSTRSTRSCSRRTPDKVGASLDQRRRRRVPARWRHLRVAAGQGGQPDVPGQERAQARRAAAADCRWCSVDHGIRRQHRQPLAARVCPRASELRD